MKQFKLILFAALLLLSSSFANALGGYGTLSGDNKRIADIIKEHLTLNNEDAFKVFDLTVSEYLKSEDWHLTYYNNDTLSGVGDVGSSLFRVVHLNLVNKNRFINITISKFTDKKILLVQEVETLPRESSLTIKKYEELKVDAKFTADIDKDNFAVFEKIGYTNRVKTLVLSDATAIQFSKFYSIEISK